MNLLVINKNFKKSNFKNDYSLELQLIANLDKLLDWSDIKMTFN